MKTHGTLTQVINNRVPGYEGLYQGNLRHYYREIFFNTSNLYAGYHNLRHELHILFYGFQVCIFMRGTWSPREMRTFLIAMLNHDANHTGKGGKGSDDNVNVNRAVIFLQEICLPEDRQFLDEMIDILWGTRFPYDRDDDSLPLVKQFARDLDMCQSLSPAWIQQVPLGLAKEWGVPAIEGFKAQAPFLQKVFRLRTAWAKEMFPQHIVEGRIQEAQEHVEILTSTD